MNMLPLLNMQTHRRAIINKYVKPTGIETEIIPNKGTFLDNVGVEKIVKDSNDIFVKVYNHADEAILYDTEDNIRQILKLMRHNV
ncbi:hypothetical protein J6E39_05035 [bacterium]|nr:hypothetical protein [bacterium]